jgi:putative redox protein
MMMSLITVDVRQISPATSEGRARNHTVLIDRPEAKGGEDRGAMGGELLLVALGGCFMSNLLAAVRAREADAHDLNVQVAGTLVDNPARFSAIKITISGAYADRDQMEKLVTIAERGCIVANSVRGAIDLMFEIEPSPQMA